jgi:hypothetical protein
MGEFARISRISQLSRVSLQLLQTMGIMIQNLKNEHSICKFSNSAVSILYLQRVAGSNPYVMFSADYIFLKSVTPAATDYLNCIFLLLRFELLYVP